VSSNIRAVINSLPDSVEQIREKFISEPNLSHIETDMMGKFFKDYSQDRENELLYTFCSIFEDEINKSIQLRYTEENK